MKTREKLSGPFIPISFLTIAFFTSFFLLFHTTCYAITVTLEWDPTDGATGYKVYYQHTTSSTQPDPPFVGTGADEGDSPITISGHDNTTATISGLDPHYFYFFAVTAFNDSGESTYSNVVYVPELVPPALSLTSPANNATVSGTVAVNADATDAYGVTRVEFFVNGALQSTDTTAPYSFSWDTSSLAAGKYTLMVKAYDANDNSGQSANAVVTVSSAVSPQPGTYTRSFGNAAGSNYLNTVQDTYLETNDNINAAATTLNTLTSPANRLANAILMKWDLSALPANAQILNATLSLYMTESSGDDLYKISVAKVIDKNPVIASCNGNTYDGTNPWDPSTVTANHVPMAQADIATSVDSPQIDTTVGYKSWNVTSIVQDWAANLGTNFGLLLNSSGYAGSGSYRHFAASETSDSNVRPKLEITYVSVMPKGDFDGDGKTDTAIYRPITGAWIINPSSSGIATTTYFGTSSDISIPGDYDGDGRTDIAVYRPGTGAWIVNPSSSGIATTTYFGSSSDTPVPGDYDSDGRTDIAIYRPSSGAWIINPSSSGIVATTYFGSSSDTPVPGDYDGDGKTDIAVYRSGSGAWIINPSSTGVVSTTYFGSPTDTPVPGDYDGVGRTEIAVWRQSNGFWYILNPLTSAVTSVPWGAPTDQPIKTGQPVQ